MLFKDYYKILGLEGTKYTQEQIKSAYRKEAKKFHPDINVGNVYAEERIKDINEAYQTLSDVNLKRKYDRKYIAVMGYRNSIFGKEKKPGKVIYDMLFGEETNIKNEKQKGNNIQTSIEINLKDGYNGCTKKLNLKSKGKKVDLKIPKGVKNGTVLKLEKLGEKSPNGGENGDLLVTINLVNYKHYFLEDNVVKYTVQISPLEAILGKKVFIENLSVDDDEIECDICELSNSTDKIILENAGYYVNDNFRENLEVNLEIISPKFINENEKELYLKLNELRQYNSN